MDIHAAHRRRKLGFPMNLNYDLASKRIKLESSFKLPNSTPRQEEDVWNQGENIKTYGPLASATISRDIIAVANEDGYINLVRKKRLSSAAHWLGHDNAIFDIKASPSGKSLLTGSGDTTIKQWDIETKECIQQINPHYSSIKSLSFYTEHIVASGSRDGAIKVHDLRDSSPTVLVMNDAHKNKILGKKRKVKSKTDPISCVTYLVFDTDIPRLYSSGANDATIKLWDIRKIRHKRTLDGTFVVNEPFSEVHHPSRGVHCGYSHLLLSYKRLYAACSDNKIYCYENFSSTDPIVFSGYRYDTYIRLAVMDNRFLFSGGRENGAKIWSLGTKRTKDSNEVISREPIGELKADDTDWCDTNVIETDWEALSVFSFRDDGLVSKWTL